MELRVMDSENKLQNVTDWIMTSDIDYVSLIFNLIFNIFFFYRNHLLSIRSSRSIASLMLVIVQAKTLVFLFQENQVSCTPFRRTSFLTFHNNTLRASAKSTLVFRLLFKPPVNSPTTWPMSTITTVLAAMLLTSHQV